MPFQEDGRPLSQADRDRMAAILGESCRQGSGNPTEDAEYEAIRAKKNEERLAELMAEMERKLTSR